MITSSVGNRIAFFGISDRGLKRANNEDHFMVANLTRQVVGVRANCVQPELIYHEIGAKGTLLAVADGLGGHQGGEIASQIAVEVTVQTLFACRETLLPAVHLRKAVEDAHEAVCRYQSRTARGRPMGSTLTAVHLGHRVMTVVQVGDSRAYLFSRGKLIQLTEDQTVVRMLQRKGMLTEEEARTHPDRDVVLQALGQGKCVTPEIRSVPFRDGDCVLLCTDGLSSYVSHAQIEAVLKAEQQENMRCQRLIDEANAAGGPDNITVLLARLFVDRRPVPQ